MPTSITGRDLKGGRVYRVEGVVLRRISFGETDRVVTLFTRSKGKLSVVAKGARGPKSRLGGATEPFTYLHALLALGQNLDVLTQAEAQNSYTGLRKDLTRVGYASYFVELIDAGTEERQPAPALWDLLVGGLGTLEAGAAPDVLCRAFELHAMSLMGYEPQVERCVLDGQSVDAPGSVFHPLRGGMLCPGCVRGNPGWIAIEPQTLAALRDLPRVPLLAAANTALPPQVRAELARCMIPYVRHHLDVNLRSLQFLEAVSD
jgi:DNA repair protein RecO (recombination protein O)